MTNRRFGKMRSAFVFALALLIVLCIAGCESEPNLEISSETETESVSVIRESSQEESILKEDTLDNSSEASSEEPSEQSQYVPHRCSYGEWSIEREPTCFQKGEMYRYCECGKSEFREIEMTEHKAILVEDKKPTCTNSGSTGKLICEVCDALLREAEPIQSIGHNYNKNKCENCGVCYNDVSDLPQEMRDLFSAEIELNCGGTLDPEYIDSTQKVLDAQMALVDLYYEFLLEAEEALENANQRTVMVYDSNLGMFVRVRDEKAYQEAEYNLKEAQIDYEKSLLDAEEYLINFLEKSNKVMWKLVTSLFSEKNSEYRNKDIYDLVVTFESVADAEATAKYEIVYSDGLKQYVGGWAEEVVLIIKEVAGIDISA